MVAQIRKKKKTSKNNIKCFSVVIRSLNSSQQVFFSSISEVSVPRQILFNIITNDQDDRMESTLRKFKGDNRLGESCWWGKVGHLSRLDKWVDINLLKFSTGKQRLLHLGWHNPMHQCRWGAVKQLWKRAWSWSQWTGSLLWCIPMVVNLTLNCINQQVEGRDYSLVSGTYESVLETTIPHFVLPTTGKMLWDWGEGSQGPPKWLRAWNISCMRRR